MLFNKYVMSLLSLLALICAAMATFDWTSVLDPSTAGKVSAGLMLIVTILHSIAPPPDQTMIVPARKLGGLITHT